MMEFFAFIGILLISTALLGFVALHSANTMPPHAGVDVNEDSSGHYIVEIETMGQADRVSIYVNNNHTATLTEVGDTVKIEKSADRTKRVLVVSDNGEQVVLLREFYA